MDINDLDKLTLGIELVCIKDYVPSDLPDRFGFYVGDIIYFITCYHKHPFVGKQAVIYLSKVAPNSNANPSYPCPLSILEHIDLRSKIREDKIGKILN